MSDELSKEELEEQGSEQLAEREEMSLVNLNWPHRSTRR